MPNEAETWKEMVGRIDRASAALEHFADTGQLHLPDDRTMRECILDDARQAVCRERNTAYGEPIDNQRRIADACNALGYRGPGGRLLKPHDMPVIMALTKLARIVVSPENQDHWVDLSGYAAVGGECVTLEDQ